MDTDVMLLFFVGRADENHHIHLLPIHTAVTMALTCTRMYENVILLILTDISRLNERKIAGNSILIRILLS